MNQILDYDVEKGGKTPRNKGNKGSGGNKNGGSSSDKIVKVFAFLLILIAIALIASGVYSLMKNKKDSSIDKTPTVSKVQATIEAQANEDNGKVVISVSSDIAINKLIYNWNQNIEKVISGEDRTTMEELIDLPAGQNTLTIKVIDMENNETIKTFSFEAEKGIDTTPPEITLEITSSKTLLITATDDNAIAFITYMWNEGEQITVEAEEEDQKEIQVELEIPRGKNTINVIAVDNSETPNTKSATKTLDGVTKPEIGYNLTADASVLELVCTHENGIKSIFYTFNGKDYEKVFEDDEISTYISFTQPSEEGENKMNLTVTSVNGTVANFNPEWQYYPNGAPEEPTGTETEQ